MGPGALAETRKTPVVCAKLFDIRTLTAIIRIGQVNSLILKDASSTLSPNSLFINTLTINPYL
jgi:hypothetical protein